MNTMAIAVATVAALAIILLAFGISSSRGSSIGERLDRYASSKAPDTRKAVTGQGGVAELIAQSQALNSLNRVVEQRDFGANLSRDLARADLRLKVSEFLMIWAVSIVAVPVIFLVLGFVIAPLGNPIALLVGLLIGFWFPRFWLKRRINSRLGAFNKQL